jgi:L-ascorbate metabolism protein UlaG (beta-lactamase superfamily)
MKIRWHGHACFEIGDGATLVTDPHDGKSIGIKPPHVKADMVFISHDHFDHNCLRVVEGRDLLVLDSCGNSNRNGIDIKGILTYHDDSGGTKRGENLLFRFVVDGIVMCHLGDLGHVLSEDMVRQLGNIDILFIPVGNVFTIGPHEAWDVVRLLNPRIVIPMHYRVGGLSLSIKPVDTFLEGAEKDSIVKVGNEIDFEKEDLPDELEVWVFTL